MAMPQVKKPEKPDTKLTADQMAAIAEQVKKLADKKPSVWDKLDVPIEHAGRAITLPADPASMPVSVAIAALQRREKDDNQPYQVMEKFDAYPHDAAVAFVRAMQTLYGFASFESQVYEGFFGKIEVPPQMISVKVGVGDDDVVQCPIGKMHLPGVGDPVETMLHNRLGFLIHGEIKKKDRHVVLELATVTRAILKEHSIYRGKPVRLGVQDDGELDLTSPPSFMDVSDISEGDVLFDPDIRAAIDTNILVPIRATAACRAHGIPLKRGILLEGQYGTGKSLTAKMAARVCELNGWTFILLDKVQGLKAALEFANRYAPALVFAEDVDRVAQVRDEKANDLINTIDGVVSKRAEIMTVLTTNFVESLNPVILRPGRLDAVITLRPPNAETVQRLVRYYARELLSGKEELGELGKELEGQIPASIRECVERAKLGMIGRAADKLSQDDLLTAARTMKNHLALLNRKQAEETVEQKLAGSLRKVILDGRGESIDYVRRGINAVANDMGVEIPSA